MTLELLHIEPGNGQIIAISVRRELLLAHLFGRISSEALVLTALNEAPAFVEVKDIEEGARNG